MTAWNSDPALTEDELDAVLAEACLTDSAGNAPTAEEWTPTYDLYAAASAAWLIKAARSSAVTEADPTGEVTSKVFDNCRAMARIYASKRAASVSVR